MMRLPESSTLEDLPDPRHLRRSTPPFPLPLNCDPENPFREILKLTMIALVQYRNSRTGNARRAVSQPDHDILEGLPIRRWHKKAVNVNAGTLDKTDSSAVPLLLNGYRELEMPKDSNMLSETCQAILRAARMGLTRRERPDDNEEGKEPGEEENVQTEEDSGLVTRKWALFSKDYEPEEPEYLAKRRKGLRPLYGGSTAPINTSGSMRKIKIRNVDVEGNSQIVEALVPEGQVVENEIVEEELTSPTQVLAPGTKVQGVGVANADGVLVPEEAVVPPAQRRRPPPPKRRLKGPGRGRKKKVAFAPGPDGAVIAGSMQAIGDEASMPSQGEAFNRVPNAEGDNEGDDSLMQDAGQDGDEGSDDGSEGEEGEDGDREDGEVSATPEALSEPSNVQVPAGEDLYVEPPTEVDLLEPPAPSTSEGKILQDAVAVQQATVSKEEPVLEQMDEPANEPPVETATPILASPLGSTIPVSAPDLQTPGTSASHPQPTRETPSRSEAMKTPDIADLSSQDSFEPLEEQAVLPRVTPTAPESANLPPKPPPSVQSELVASKQDLGVHLETGTEDPIREATIDSPIEASPVAIDLSNRPENEAQHSQIPPPPAKVPDILADNTSPPRTEPLPIHKAPSSPQAMEVPAPVPQPEQIEISQQAPIEIRPATIEHHTPKAPTPSPPTPIATSFDEHQRERLMESPRAPTMSPPTPARDFSSSPDMPLAGQGNPPPLALDSASGPQIPGLDQQLPPTDERIDVEAAPEAPESYAAEIPHEHDPLSGLAAPKVPDGQRNEGEEPETFPDGEEDLLGSLERSLGR